MESALAMIKIAAVALGAIIAILWILTIIWVIKDAGARGVSKVWGAVAIVPFLGALVYIAARPPMLVADREELDAEMLLTRRQLMDYGECGRCGYPVEKDFVMCPSCGAQLKAICPNCGRPLNPEWSVCPYCCSHVSGRPARPAQQPQMAQPAPQPAIASQEKTSIMGSRQNSLPEQTEVVSPAPQAPQTSEPHEEAPQRYQRRRHAAEDQSAEQANDGDATQVRSSRRR